MRLYLEVFELQRIHMLGENYLKFYFKSDNKKRERPKYLHLMVAPFYVLVVLGGIAFAEFFNHGT